MSRSNLIDLVCAWALEMPGAYLDLPFGPDVYTYKVAGRIFLLVHITFVPVLFSLKAVPDDSLALRLEHPQIIPGYHLNKRHWISIRDDCALPESLVRSLLSDSYENVVEKLPKAEQVKLMQIGLRQ